MIIEVQFFARARDPVGQPSAEVELGDSASVADLRAELGKNFPELKPLLPQLFIAINEDFVSDTQSIPEQARVACFPPVSGG